MSQNSEENTYARVSFLIKLQAAHISHWLKLYQVFNPLMPGGNKKVKHT